MKLLVIEGFSYPKEFLEIMDRDLRDLRPWKIINGRVLQLNYEGLLKRYPDRKLIPFAKRLDNDDVACWAMGWEEKYLSYTILAPPVGNFAKYIPTFGSGL